MLSIGFDAPRILDFDVEARPLGWLGGDYVHKEITAVASAWIVDGEPEDMQVHYITKDERSHKRMFKAVRERFRQADMVTGHYIRGYDLPNLNANFIEWDVEPLNDTLAHDTKLDLVKHTGMSKSQENLSAMAGIEAPKIQMDVPAWREANRLTRRGLERTIERVVGDVIQNIHLRAWLMERDLLSTPRVWRPGAHSGIPGYTP